MGSDNLFHKRKARKANDIKRQKQKRDPYAKVLIVCEGEKSEPHYLQAIRDHYKLSPVNIEIDPNSDSSPISVINYAKERIKASADDPYDHVYCVIDRDTHADFERAMNDIAKHRSKETKLHAIVSYPCFEYWILLHYAYVTKPFGISGESPCQELIRTELKNYIPDYEKGDASIMTNLVRTQLEVALNYAQRAEKEAERRGTADSSTQFHQLINFLKAIKG